MNTLKRVLRLRSIFEEISRTELAAEAQRARQLESAVDQKHLAIARHRRESFEGLGQADTDSWVLAEQAREVAEWQVQQIAPLAEQQSLRVAAARDVFMERRNERRQVETVIENRQAEIERMQGRREQQELDEWFAMCGRRDREAGRQR